MRRTTAVALLTSGIDLTTISQWLGHSNPNPHIGDAIVDLEMKRPLLIVPVRPGAETSPFWNGWKA